MVSPSTSPCLLKGEKMVQDIKMILEFENEVLRLAKLKYGVRNGYTTAQLDGIRKEEKARRLTPTITPEPVAEEHKKSRYKK